jgi:ATP-dependent protease ClpP protease subunit
MNKITIDSDIAEWGYGSRWLSNQLVDRTGELQVDISTYGGDVFEGIDMFNQLRRYSREKGLVTTIAGSKVMSIGSLILLAGDKRKAHSNSTIMIHKAWTWLAGNSDELLAEAEVLTGLDIILAKQYGKHMSQSHDEIMNIMQKEGWYIGQEQIKGTNFIDEFIVSDDEVEVSAKSNFTKAMAKFSARAKEENIKPNLDKVKAIIVECNDGKCPMENKVGVNQSSYTASAQIKNSTQGNSMEYTQEKFLALENTHAEAMKVMASERDSAKATLAEVNAKLATAEAVLAEYKAKVEAKAKAMPEIMAMAYEKGVDKNTLLAMANADSLDKAKVALVDGMTSNGAFGASGETSSEEKTEEKTIDIQARADKLGVTFIGEE